MNDFLQLLNALNVTSEIFTIQDILLATLLSFVLSAGIGWVYMVTYRGTAYTQTYVHTLIILSMVVAIIMLIIGSNIARAFTLVGALSIVRFRNAVKDTRDVGFIFLALAVGMACGTRFYLVAIVATLVIGTLIWAMVRFNMFARKVKEQILKIRLPEDIPYNTIFDDLFPRYLNRAELIAMETVQAGMLTELVYSVEMKRQADVQAFLAEIRQRNQNNKVALVTGLPEVEL
jgi:hypothetical protein